MNKLNLQPLVLFFSISLLVLTGSGCNKTDDPQPQSKSKTTLLTQANWKLIKAEEKASGAATWNDITSIISPCRRDDIYVFNTAGTWELNEGPTKCSPADPNIFLAGTWIFFNNETQLKRYEGSGTSLLLTYNIELLDESGLIITTTSGLIYTRDTYGH